MAELESAQISADLVQRACPRAEPLGRPQLHSMLGSNAIILIVLWLLALITSYPSVGLIHISLSSRLKIVASEGCRVLRCIP